MADTAPSDFAFLQFAAPRIAEAHRRVGQAIWVDVAADLRLQAAAATHEHRTAVEADKLAYEAIDVQTLPLTWGRKWQQKWWRLTLTEPTATDLYLRWHDQAEATIYDGQLPFYGFDAGHHHAPLPAGKTTFGIESTCQNAAIWVPNAKYGLSESGSVFRGVSLCRRDEAAWQLWHDLDVLIDLCRILHRQTEPKYEQRTHGAGDLFDPVGFRPPIESCHPMLRIVLRRLATAVDVLDRDGAEAATVVTGDLFASLPASSWAPDAVLTGHAHIDLIWKWPERTGEAKAVHTFANALSMLEQYPEMTFGYSQPASYEAVLRRSPEVMAKVDEQIEASRWEVAGGMYVESDTEIACGEALLRSVEIGCDEVERLSGEAADLRVAAGRVRVQRRVADDSGGVWHHELLHDEAALESLDAVPVHELQLARQRRQFGDDAHCTAALQPRVAAGRSGFGAAGSSAGGRPRGDAFADGLW